MGIIGSLNPQDYDSDFKNKSTGQSIVWPQPQLMMPSSVDALWHAAVNGRGQFLKGDTYEELAESLSHIMHTIAAPNVSSAAVAASGDWLFGKVGTVNYIYQPSYNTSTWTGDVRAYALNSTTGQFRDKDSLGNPIPVWSAAEKFSARDWTTRLVASYDPDSGTGIDFDFDKLTTGHKTSLDNDKNTIAYIRGKLVTDFRTRVNLLGDIVHSAPVFSNNTLYVGANDGMLHAFDAETGVERFAYVPSLLIKNLKFLTKMQYSHQYYVDQTPTIKTDYGLLGGASNETLLVGGLGQGGQGYYALDVSDPQAMNTTANVVAKVLWEYPRTSTPNDDQKDVGYSFSRPILTKSNDPNYPWVVIFGNGYNSSSENSVLFILNARTGALVKKITAVDDKENGLSTPIAVDANGDGTVDFLYAGDLKGNLWKFDLASNNASDWSVAFKSGVTPKPLFTAKGPGGSLQPITTKPDVMQHPHHGYLVAFGTGKYLGEGDYNDTSTQSVYGIWDYGDRIFYGTSLSGGFTSDDASEYLGEFSRSSTTQLSNQPQKVSLLQQTRIADVASGSQRVRLLSSNQTVWKTQADNDSGQKPNPSSVELNHAGWYFDLPNTRERVISDITLRDGKAILIAFTPNEDPCLAGGKSFLMQINAYTGGAPAKVQFDINGDGKLTSYKDSANPGDGIAYLSQPYVPVGVELDGNVQPPAILRLNHTIEIMYAGSSTGRIETIRNRAVRLGIISWREMED
jgi:type IV pilus assembly protein PilY1